MTMLPILTLLALNLNAPAADAPALAQLRAQLPTPGLVLADHEDPAGLTAGLPQGTTREVVAVAAADRVPARAALRIRVAQAYQPYYLAQVFSGKSAAPLKRGDAVLVSCWLRAPEAAGGKSGVAALRLQMDRDPWTSPAEATVACERSWKQVFAVGVAHQDFASGALQLALQIGQQAQILDIAGVVVLNLGPGVDVAKLPHTRITWPGMEPDAPWRPEAQRRIQQYRMADLQIQVLDAQGRPVPGVAVRVRQEQRAFTIGSFVQFADPTRLLTASPDGDQTRAVFERLFNRATCPIYWADWGWPKRRDEFLAIARWLHDRHYAVRGHVMVYPGFRYLPAELAKLKGDPAKLQARILEHVREIGEATKPFGFREYDVTNELRDCVDLHQLLGRDAVAQWYAEARRILPGAKLALNENTILTQGGATVANQDLYLDWYRFLKSKGQAPDVLGFQAHFGEAFTGPETVWAVLDRFAKETEAELQITEFDINTLDEEAQGNYTRDFLTACFAHPRITGFTMWGFWEGDQFTPRGACWRQDWSIKPNGKVLEELLTKTWWTDARGTTDAQGRATVKAFLGRHGVSATLGDKPVAAAAVLEQAGQSVTVTLRP